MKPFSQIHPDERIDPLTMPEISHAERQAHLLRYEFACDVIQQHFSDHSAKLKLLDAACGLGYGSRMLSSLPRAQVMGLDIDPDTIQQAAKLYGAPKITFEQQNLVELSVLNTFDAVVSFETIEHVSLEEATQIIQKFFQSLKHQGVLIMSSPNRIVTGVLEKLGLKNEFHKHEFYPAELAALCRTVGFSRVELVGQTFAFPLTYWLARNQSLPSNYFKPSRVWPHMLCQNTIVVCTK